MFYECISILLLIFIFVFLGGSSLGSALLAALKLVCCLGKNAPVSHGKFYAYKLAKYCQYCEQMTNVGMGNGLFCTFNLILWTVFRTFAKFEEGYNMEPIDIFTLIILKEPTCHGIKGRCG